MSELFKPVTFRSVTARNRIMVSPMCQYSAVDGVANEWHFQNLASRAVGGAGIVCVEMTNVEARGRITAGCMGLWNDAQRDALAPLARFIKSSGAVPAIQIGHAGRKASTSKPWEGGKGLEPGQGGWPIVGPSAIPFGEGYPMPQEMDAGTIADIVSKFAASTRRAREAGFEIVEIHGAHGYLVSAFLSPVSNRRTDRYGGSVENRARFLLEVVDAVRSEWPAEKPLFVRISCTDWMEAGWSVDDSVKLAKLLKAGGKVDLVDCSSGGVDARQKLSAHPGFQVPFAEAVRKQAGIATGAVGMISAPEMAEEILASGKADLILIARALLNDPYWPLHAAKALKVKVQWPNQYLRGDIF